MWPVLAFAVMAVARWGASFSPPLYKNMQFRFNPIAPAFHGNRLAASFMVMNSVHAGAAAARGKSIAARPRTQEILKVQAQKTVPY